MTTAVERMNPIVLKEMQQALRSRITWALFGVLMTACVAVAVLGFVRQRALPTRTHGPDFFFVFLVSLWVMHFFVVPYTAYRSMAREQELDTWELLTLTGLGPHRIARGKVASSLLLAVLYGSVVAPFVVFSYFLEGLDLRRVGLGLIIDALGLLFFTNLSVAAATLARTTATRILTGVIALLALAGVTALGVLVAQEIAFKSVGSLASLAPALLGVALCAAAVSYFFYQATAARLMLPSEDHGAGPRQAFLVMLVGATPLSALIVMSWSGLPDWPLVHQTASMLAVALFGAFLATGAEQGTPSPRRAWSLWRPGVAAGFRFMLVVIVLATAWWATSDLILARGRAWLPIVALGAHALLYLALALLIARARDSMLATPAGTRVLYFSLVVAAVLVGAAVRALHWPTWLMVLSPLYAAHAPGHEATLFLAVIAAGLAVAADRLLTRRARRALGASP